MNRITIRKRDLKPFETLEGSVSWNLEKPPKDLELRIFWHTRGRGTEESGTHFTLPLGEQTRGEKTFSCTLPGSPWSVDGRLISIIWAVELVEKRAGSLALEEFALAPEGRALVLDAVEAPRSEHRLARRMKRAFRQKP